jgi:hypothetical protein
MTSTVSQRFQKLERVGKVCWGFLLPSLVFCALFAGLFAYCVNETSTHDVWEPPFARACLFFAFFPHKALFQTLDLCTQAQPSDWICIPLVAAMRRILFSDWAVGGWMSAFCFFPLLLSSALACFNPRCVRLRGPYMVHTATVASQIAHSCLWPNFHITSVSVRLALCMFC